MDREFEPLHDGLKASEETQEARLNTTGTGEHVPEIERRIRVIKERTRAERAMLPYTYLPTLMIADLIVHIVTWMNEFPTTGGVGPYLPRTLLTGTQLSFEKTADARLERTCRPTKKRATTPRQNAHWMPSVSVQLGTYKDI